MVKTSEGKKRYAYGEEIKSVTINKAIAKIKVGNKEMLGRKTGYIAIKGIKRGIADVEIELDNGDKWTHKLVVQYDLSGIYRISPYGSYAAIYQIPSKNIVYKNQAPLFKFVPITSMNLDFIYPPGPNSRYSNYKITINTRLFPSIFIIINYYNKNNPDDIIKQEIYKRVNNQR